MTEVILRLAPFTLLPVLLGAALLLFDRSTTSAVRRLEAFIIPLFLIGVGGSGLATFIADVFIAEPLRLVTGIASLTVGVMGALASERRDWFREATVAAAALLGIAMLASVGMWPGILDLIRPVLLLALLLALRPAESREPQTIVLRSWTIPVRRGSVAAVGIAATAHAVGQSTGQVVLLRLAGMTVAAIAFWLVVSRSASHRAAPAP